MTRLTVTLNEAVLEEAKSLLHARTKRETIEMALDEVIKQKRREEAIKHCGEIEIQLTQDELEAYRNQD